MTKRQKLNFRRIDDFFDYVPPEELVIVHALRRLILDTLPFCRESLAYNVPFYYGRSRICYVWPACIPWGGIKTGVAIGFCQGGSFKDESQYLEKRGKGLAVKIFTTLGEIDLTLLRTYLYEAWEAD